MDLRRRLCPALNCHNQMTVTALTKAEGNSTILPFSKKLCRSRRQILGILLVIVASPVMFFLTMDRAQIMIKDLRDTNRLVQLHLKENVENEKGTGCDIPHLEPFAEEVANVTKILPIVTCNATEWVNCEHSECYIKKDLFKTMMDIICTYRDIIYVDDKNFFFGPPVKVLGADKYTLNKSDHVKVDCTGLLIDGPHIAPSQWSGYKTEFRPVPVVPLRPDRKDSYNVMIICFDSTSRNEFIRKMHKSYKYLTEKLHAIILNSYNIVGDGTTGALYPILTGKVEEEHYYPKNRAITSTYVDTKQFLFHLLKEYGYRSAYFEDMPWMGSSHKFNWFSNQPADHYLRSYFMAIVSEAEKWKVERLNRHCIGNTPQYKFMMNLADQFLQLNGKKFCFTLISDSLFHENFTLMPTADEALISFLRDLEARRVFEDTLVIIMGDHGSRFSSIRDTYQGKLEERLPLMAILLPEKLKQTRLTAVNALEHNIDVLTTPFDIHATILDVLDLRDLINKHKIPGSDLPRSMSLLEPIPKSRSCGEAGVMPHWCACTRWFNVSQSDPVYGQVARVLAEYINSISQEQRTKCAQRRLISTEWVLHQSANDILSKVNYYHIKEMNHFLKYSNKAMKTLDEYYQAKIIMSPGKGVFEGTMIYNAVGDYYMITQRDISRISAYGDEPNCVSESHPHLNKYCYCKDRLHSHTHGNITSNVQ